MADMGEAYPIIVEKKKFVLEVIDTEESRFRETLERGLQILEEAFDTHCTDGGLLPGNIAFQLHDTFGFPLDLTQLIASERNIGIDVDGYNAKMAEQRAMGRANWKGSGDAGHETSAMTALKTVKQHLLAIPKQVMKPKSLRYLIKRDYLWRHCRRMDLSFWIAHPSMEKVVDILVIQAHYGLGTQRLLSETHRNQHKI